tara:strand:+ start:487 stop:678 length:192 start_codon:yes stop_codon:yes gene_type:complete
VRRPVKGQYRLPVPVYLFRRRSDESGGGGPPYTPEEEIETESTGLYFITEASSNANPDYIITE